MNNAEDWLESWIEENIDMPQYCESKEEMSDKASSCRLAANEDNIDAKDLNEAADGDLEYRLMRAQNTYTDAVVRHKASSDKH